jgi:hypothetical protein
MYKTPWHGEADLASRNRLPLTNVYFLSKGIENKLVPLRGYDAAGRLFPRSFPLFYSPQGLDFTLNFLEEIVRTIHAMNSRFYPMKKSWGYPWKRVLQSKAGGERCQGMT